KFKLKSASYKNKSLKYCILRVTPINAPLHHTLFTT
ncbi:MAG: hypothetical protein ACI8W9_001699, partial [Psychromonas sp.]